MFSYKTKTGGITAGLKTYIEKKQRRDFSQRCVGIDLFSRSVSRQVSSALMSLTSVFGMGTGVPSPLKTPTAYGTYQILQYLVPFVKGKSGDRSTGLRMVHLQGLEPWTP